MTKAEMTKKIVEYVIEAYFSLISNGADVVNFMMIYADGHNGRDYANLRAKGVNPDNGYITVFSLEDFKEFCIKTNAIKIKNDSKSGHKSTSGKGKAEIRVGNSVFLDAIKEMNKKTYPVNLDNLRKVTNQTNNGYAFECFLQYGNGQIAKYSDYKPDNNRFDKTGDVITKSGVRIQAKTNRCSLTYLFTLNNLYPMSEEIKEYCEKCGFAL